MTQKLDPPATDKPEVVDFSKLSGPEKITAFKEALKSDDLKNVDLYDTLGLDKPAVETPSMNKEVIEKLLPEYESTRAKLAEAGYKFEEAKMSAVEQKFADKIEKQSQAKFAEQRTDILKIDADFPVDSVANMSIPTEDKVTVMATMREIAVRNQESVSGLKTELDTATAELKEAKLAAPDTDKTDERAGEDIVNAKFSQYGWEDPTKSTDTNDSGA
jgi:hypothetical protein